MAATDYGVCVCVSCTYFSLYCHLISINNTNLKLIYTHRRFYFGKSTHMSKKMNGNTQWIKITMSKSERERTKSKGCETKELTRHFIRFSENEFSFQKICANVRACFLCARVRVYLLSFIIFMRESVPV